ncbi:MAG: hypothetical protein P0Y53_13360 [Candidatus Pseudobacter hemicellulosilyticus]|uniref:Uncharacterized protein n=1 Tax=Candidatus Pseudobacter hemicellulosilyticus TaxID=3121375 RepID=A0AAJ5WN57_9BACT|nr:MAG: hypothetical protein P0Y53_13360 [Pseudobacter sp.]
MNNNSITSYADLLQEEERLKMQLKHQQEVVHLRVQELKQKIAPATNLISMVGNLASPKSNSLLSAGIGIAVDFILKKSLLRKAGWLTRLAGSFLARKVVVNKVSPLVENAVDQLLHKKKAKQG